MINEQDLIAGTTWEWTDYFDDYPSSEYTAECIIRKGSAAAITIESSVSSTEDEAFDFSKDAVSTASITPGDYQFQYIFTNIADGKIYAPKIYSGFVPVDPLLSSASDVRSDDQKVLDSLIAARTKIAERDYVNVTINGKATTFKRLNEIDAQIIRYKKKLGIYQTPEIYESFR